MSRGEPWSLAAPGAPARGELPAHALGDLRLEHERLRLLVDLVERSLGVDVGGTMAALLIFDLSRALAQHLVNEEALRACLGSADEGSQLHQRMYEAVAAIRELLHDGAPASMRAQHLLIFRNLLHEDVVALDRRCAEVGLDPVARLRVVRSG